MSKQMKVAKNGNRALIYEHDFTIKAGYEPRPRHLNPESPADRKKRLDKRKALTLKLFQETYEDHRQRKAS